MPTTTRSYSAVLGSGKGLPKTRSVQTSRKPPPPGARTKSSVLSAVVKSTPAVGNFSPAPGTQVSASTPILFDATDSKGFRHILVYAAAANGGRELVWDGSSFSAQYAAGSACWAISNGLRFQLVRAGGWTVAPNISVVAVNLDGNEA